MDTGAFGPFLLIGGMLKGTVCKDDRLAIESLCPANHGLRDLIWVLSKHTLNGGKLVAEDEENDLCAWKISV